MRLWNGPSVAEYPQWTVIRARYGDSRLSWATEYILREGRWFELDGWGDDCPANPFDDLTQFTDIEVLAAPLVAFSDDEVCGEVDRRGLYVDN
jgi:hypothetical protein